MKNKICIKCEIKKSRTEFYAHRTSKDSLQSWCKACQGIAQKNRRLTNPERIKKRNLKTQQLKHGVKTCSACEIEKKLTKFFLHSKTKDGRQSWCKACTQAVHKTYLPTNATKIKDKTRHLAYRQTGVGKVVACRAASKYRALKLGATIGPINEAAIFEACDDKCTYCGSKEKLSLDHIVPLSKSGPHCQDNLTVACRSCNSSKNAKFLDKWLETNTNHNKGCEDINAA